MKKLLKQSFKNIQEFQNLYSPSQLRAGRISSKSIKDQMPFFQ